MKTISGENGNIPATAERMASSKLQIVQAAWQTQRH